jgi:hypothetical protein
MPEGAVYVGRPTKWGNPFRPGDPDDEGNPMDTAAAMECYAAYVQLRPDLAESARRELVGKDLACWCRLGAPCHADILLELANR